MDGIANRATVAALLLALVAMAACGDNEAEHPAASRVDTTHLTAPPVHRGRPITHWIEQLDTPLIRDGQEVGAQSVGADDAFGLHHAVQVLVEIGPDAVPFLVRALETGNERTKENAAKALGRVRPGATSAIPALLKAALVEDAGSAYEAVLALSGAGPESPAVLNFLERLLRDGPRSFRLAAIQSLGKLGPRAGRTVPLLTRVITDWLEAMEADPSGSAARRSEADALEAARAIGMVGSDAEETSSALVRAFRLSQRGGFGAALGKIRSPEAKLVLLEALRSDSQGSREGALAGLWWIHEWAPEAIPRLQELLRDPNADRVRWNAAMLLGRYGKAAKDAVPALLSALDHEDPKTRHYAAEALGDVGDASAKVMDALRTTTKDRSDWVRRAARTALDHLRTEESGGK